MARGVEPNEIEIGTVNVRWQPPTYNRSWEFGAALIILPDDTVQWQRATV